MRDSGHQAMNLDAVSSGQSASNFTMGVASVSMLDLPWSILTDIVTWIRRAILYDGYVCELRLVCRSFNDAVLHCLHYRDLARDFFPMHYMSCPTRHQSCHRRTCMSVGQCNRTYARYRLQAELQISKVKSRYRLGYEQALNDAMNQFVKYLSDQDAVFATARSHVENVNPFGCASSDSVFANKSSVLFCEATLTLIEVINRYRYDFTHLDRDLTSCNTWFWLCNLASFLGDGKLFDLYSSLAYPDGTNPANLFTHIPKLLATTAARNHQVLFQHILRRLPTPPGYTPFEPALRGALYSGDLQIMNSILEACPEEMVATLCTESLSHLYSASRLPANYAMLAKKVVSRCGEIPIDRFRVIVWTQAELGVSSVVSLLLQRHSNCTLWPYTPDMLVSSFSPLWSACVNGDVYCVRTLIRDGFFARIRKDDARTLYFDCMEAAVQANSFEICQELCKLIGIEIHDLSFDSLAGVDRSIEAMKRRFEFNPYELHTKTFHFGASTIGEAALKPAIEVLRPENVKFLLERGVRLCNATSSEPLKVEWRRKHSNEQRYRQVQELLQRYGYGLEQLQVEL